MRIPLEIRRSHVDRSHRAERTHRPIVSARASRVAVATAAATLSTATLFSWFKPVKPSKLGLGVDPPTELPGLESVLPPSDLIKILRTELPEVYAVEGLPATGKTYFVKRLLENHPAVTWVEFKKLETHPLLTLEYELISQELKEQRDYTGRIPIIVIDDIARAFQMIPKGWSPDTGGYGEILATRVLSLVNDGLCKAVFVDSRNVRELFNEFRVSGRTMWINWIPFSPLKPSQVAAILGKARWARGLDDATLMTLAQQAGYQLPRISRVFSDVEVEPPPLRMDSSGAVDPASPAVRDGRVVLNSDGTIDGRCSAVKEGRVVLKGDGYPAPQSRLLGPQLSCNVLDAKGSLYTRAHTLNLSELDLETLTKIVKGDYFNLNPDSLMRLIDNDLVVLQVRY